MTEPHTERPAPAAGQPTGSTGRARALGILASTGALAFLVDLLTKQWTLHALGDGEPLRLLGGAVYLTLIRNSGAAFSLGSDVTFVFPIITLVVIGWILWLARKLRSAAWAVALGLVLGGAMGNLADRIFRAPGPFLGHVVDMISLFDDNGEIWPVFNVADSCLMVGVGLAILLELTGRQRSWSAPADAGARSDTSSAQGAVAGARLASSGTKRSSSAAGGTSSAPARPASSGSEGERAASGDPDARDVPASSIEADQGDGE